MKEDVADDLEGVTEKANSPSQSHEELKKSIANSLPVQLAKVQADIKDKKKQMLTHYHDFIGFNGLYVQPSSEDNLQWSFTETFNYDPIRCSIGSFWIKPEGETVRYANNKPNEITATHLNKVLSGTTNDKDFLTPLTVCDVIRPRFEYKFHPSTLFSKIGIEGFKLSTPVTTLPSSQKTRLLNLGKVQYIFFNFDFADYSEPMKKLAPFNLFYTIRQKQEGYFFTAPGLTGAQEHHNLLFSMSDPQEINAPTGVASPILSNQSYFVGPKSDEDFLINTMGAVDGEYKGVSVYFGQDSLINKIEDETYFDHTIQSPAAISEEATPFFGSESLQGQLIADVKPFYNYFLTEWEYITPQLPEIFILSAYQAAINDDENKKGYAASLRANFKQFANSFIYCSSDYMKGKKAAYLTFNPDVRKSQNIIIDQNRELIDLVDDIKTQYPMYNEISFAQITPGEMSLAMKESGLTMEFIKTLSTYIYGDYQDKSVAGASLKIAKILGLSTILPKILEGKDMDIVSSLKDPASFDFFEDNEEYTHIQKSATCYDFLSWLEWYLSEIDDVPSTEDLKIYNISEYGKTTSFFGDKKFRNNHTAKKDNNSFFKVINLIQFMGNFSSMVNARSRDFHEILSGDGSHFASSDVLYYRIEKRISETNEVIQNFFVLPEDLNPEKGYSSKLKVIDTQVKYGVSYEYEIYAVKIVVGTQYKYRLSSHSAFDSQEEEFVFAAQDNYPNEYVSPLQAIEAALPSSTAGGKQIKLYPRYGSSNTTSKAVMPVRVDYCPTVKIYECPMYKESDVIITDSPPLPPIVNVYPLSGKRNKILFTFETQTGDRELQPIAFKDGDGPYFAAERLSQKRDVQYPGGGFIYPTLRFKSDDDSSKYELFRIKGEENIPTKYEDFDTRGKKKTLNKLQPIPEAGFEDKIEVNTKYYYTFRSRDMHNNISNPTDIYCVEMIDLGKDVFFPLIELKTINNLKAKVKISEPDNSVKTKKIKKRVQIKAADQQILLNEEASGITGETAVNKDIVLGVAEKSLWNDKRFKFRFTSRHTGKTIDVNVKFKANHNSPSETNSEPVGHCFDAYATFDE